MTAVLLVRDLYPPERPGPLNEKVPHLVLEKARKNVTVHVPGQRNLGVGQDILAHARCQGQGHAAVVETDGGIHVPDQDLEVHTVDAGLATPGAAVDPDQAAMKGGGVTTEVIVGHPCQVVDGITEIGVARRRQQNLKKIQRRANAWECLA